MLENWLRIITGVTTSGIIKSGHHYNFFFLYFWELECSDILKRLSYNLRELANIFSISKFFCCHIICVTDGVSEIFNHNYCQWRVSQSPQCFHFLFFLPCFVLFFLTVSQTAFACLHGNINKSFITALPLWLKKIYQIRLSLHSSSGAWNICISQKYHAAYKLNEMHHCYCAKQ